MQWIECFLTVIREGLGAPISLEFLLPHTGQERIDILREVDAVALYHYKLKVVYEDKIRRRFGRLQGQTDADAEDEATQALVQGVVGEIDFGELIQGDALDLAAEESDDSEDESSSETESCSDEDDDDDDDVSEESVVVVPKPPLRSHTIGPSKELPVSPPGNKSPVNEESVRPMPFSLRMSRSLASLRQRARQQKDVPSVPPLPNGASSSDQVPTPPLRSSTDQKSPPRTPRKPSSKAKAQALKYPELEHLPKLLPIFTELVSQFQ